jgi:hypothetical protein
MNADRDNFSYHVFGHTKCTTYEKCNSGGGHRAVAAPASSCWVFIVNFFGLEATYCMI